MAISLLIPTNKRYLVSENNTGITFINYIRNSTAGIDISRFNAALNNGHRLQPRLNRLTESQFDYKVIVP
jgi:hypothetical protein